MPTYNTENHQLFPGAGELNNLWMQAIQLTPGMTTTQEEAAWAEANVALTTIIAGKIETACYAVEDGTIEIIPFTDDSTPAGLIVLPLGVRFAANQVSIKIRIVQWVLRGYTGSI